MRSIQTIEAHADVAARIDLQEVPFSLPKSRVVVLHDAESLHTGIGLSLHEIRYEVSLHECAFLNDLRVTDGNGASIPVSAANLTHLTWSSEGPWLTVTEDDTILVGPLPAGWQASWTPGPLGVTHEFSAVVPKPDSASSDFDGKESKTHVIAERDGAMIALAPGDRRPYSGSPSATIARARNLLDEWMDRCPEVLPELTSMTRFCWWVLGTNTLRLGGAADGLAVVPSKIGYVGLWQWDAYFIAIGLRHGAPELAAEQLRIAVAHQGTDGQLPDVVHESGILASSEDLPPADLDSLRALGSSVVNQGRVPLTKPPLTALAVELVDAMCEDDLITELTPAVRRSQDWWFDSSDLDTDGVPEYLHPYSSGLDDSPVFDAGTPMESPDLTAYLCLQDTLLSTWARREGQLEAERSHLERAERLRIRLDARFDPDLGAIPAVGPDGPAAPLSIVSLMPLLAPDISPDLRDALLALLDNARAFGGPTPVSTVARADAEFSPERMWRGPVWVNTNWLVVQGLRQQGESDRADALEDATLRLVMDAGGPSEYFNPSTRRRAPQATRCFGWSAALFVDLAVSSTARTAGTIL